MQNEGITGNDGNLYPKKYLSNSFKDNTRNFGQFVDCFTKITERHTHTHTQLFILFHLLKSFWYWHDGLDIMNLIGAFFFEFNIAQSINEYISIHYFTMSYTMSLLMEMLTQRKINDSDHPKK